MNFEFEKPKTQKQLREEYQNDPHEKGSLEVGEAENAVRIKKREGITSQEEASIQRDIHESEKLKSAIADLFSEWDKEAEIDLPDEELRWAINNPKQYALQFDYKTKDKKPSTVLAFIEKQMQDFIKVQEHFAQTYEIVLEQRLGYKDVSPDIDHSIKEELDARIHLVQRVQKNIADIIDFLEAKRGEYFVKGIQEGTIEEDGEDEEGEID